MSGVLFDFDAARRISRTVREFEQGRNRETSLENGGLNASNQAWVKTPASLPGGYDGTEALTGTIVYVLEDGTVYDTTTECYIKDPNAGPLEEDKVYRGTFNGAFEQSGTTLGLHLVQSQPSTSTPTLEYVLPWKWVDVTFDAAYYGSTYTQKGLLFTRLESQLHPKSGTIPDLGNMASPGEDYWLDPSRLNAPDADITPYFIDGSPHDPLPVYSTSNTAFLSTSSTDYYEGATAASFYLSSMGLALPKILGKFVSSQYTTVAKYGGGTMPIKTNVDINSTSYHSSYPVKHLVSPFLATVKYKSMSGAIWGVTSTPYSWKTSGGTTKDLYFWFPDIIGLLANSGADQQVLVTPIANTKMDATFTNYQLSAKTNGDVIYLITNKF